MSDHPRPHPVYIASSIDEDVLSLLYRIQSLAKIGVAASDSLMNVEISTAEHQTLYEMIAALAQDAAAAANGPRM